MLLAIAFAFVFGFGVVANSGGMAAAQFNVQLRGMVDQTENDLQAAAQLAQGPQERARYRAAQQKLQSFDSSLAHGSVNKVKLSAVIAALSTILNKNTLQASTRDALRADQNALQAAYNKHN